MSVTKNFKQMLKSKDIDALTQWFTQIYINKYYDIYLQQLRVKGLDYQPKLFLMGQLWKTGSAWIRKNIVGDPVVTQYAGTAYNHYNYPTKVTLINTHNAPLTEIPNTPQVVDKDGVIVWLRPNHKGLEDDINYYVSKLAEAETCITIQLALSRTPWIFCGDGINNQKLENLCQEILGNDPVVFANMDKNEIETVDLPRNYIIDKLTEYEERIENKVKTLLGVDNSGTIFNREQQNLDQTNASNDEINDMGNGMYETLKDSFDRANKLLQFAEPLTVEQTSQPVEQISKTHERFDAKLGELNNEEQSE